MPDLPDFLSPTLNLSGSWEEDILPMLYSVFETDFKLFPPKFLKYQVGYDRRILEDEKEEGFWHIITKAEKKNRKEERCYDSRRAERIHWIKPLILNHSHNMIKSWNYLESSGKVRNYIWIEDHNFIVILQWDNNKQEYILITSYFIENSHTKRKLLQKFNDRIK